MAARRVVGFYPYVHGVGMGNLMWVGKWPMRSGRFPPGHPVGGGTGDSSEIGASEGIEAFRARGYWASCFPEGDGITWKPTAGQSTEQALIDVRECFPDWQVIERDEFQPLLDQYARQEAEKERGRRRAFIEAKERARTGLCSHIIRFGVYCSLQPGHAGKHAYVPPPPPPDPSQWRR